MIDGRFTGGKHFWSAIAVDRPRKLKNLLENIQLYAPEGKFTEEEKIQYLVDLTGQFPLHRVVSEATMASLARNHIPPISEFDPELEVVWVIPRNVTKKKDKHGKDYFVVDVTDSNSSSLQVRCWGVDSSRDRIQVNVPYMVKPSYAPDWGFSTRGPLYRVWKKLA